MGNRSSLISFPMPGWFPRVKRFIAPGMIDLPWRGRYQINHVVDQHVRKRGSRIAISWAHSHRTGAGETREAGPRARVVSRFQAPVRA
jgi:hypothetical protein